jgi:hypothetical protein
MLRQRLGVHRRIIRRRGQAEQAFVLRELER